MLMATAADVLTEIPTRADDTSRRGLPLDSVDLLDLTGPVDVPQPLTVNAQVTARYARPLQPDLTLWPTRQVFLGIARDGAGTLLVTLPGPALRALLDALSNWVARHEPAVLLVGTLSEPNGPLHAPAELDAPAALDAPTAGSSAGGDIGADAGRAGQQAGHLPDPLAGRSALSVFTTPTLRIAHGFLLPDHVLTGLRHPATLWLCEQPGNEPGPATPIAGLSLRAPLPQATGQLRGRQLSEPCGASQA